MKKLITVISAAIFALGLASVGMAETPKAPAKPQVKKEATAVKSEASKEVKPAKTKKEAKKVAKKSAKKGKAEKKSQPEKK
jgi:hypothetical protein